MAKTGNEKLIKQSVNAKLGVTNYDAIDIQSTKLSVAELQLIRKTLAKRANQRLVRLERATSTVTGESYAGYGAAEIAYDYLKGTKKFKEDQPLRYTESFGYSADTSFIKKEILSLQKFLTSKSSTVKGQREIEQKRIKTFSSGDWGTGGHNPFEAASNKEFFDFLNSDTLENLVGSGLTSEDIVDVYVRAVDTIDKHDEVMSKLAQALEDFQSQKTKVSVKALENKVLKKKKNKKK